MQGYGKEADLWSVGVIMFLLLCGKLPFDGDDHNEIIRSTIQVITLLYSSGVMLAVGFTQSNIIPIIPHPTSHCPSTPTLTGRPEGEPRSLGQAERGGPRPHDRPAQQEPQVRHIHNNNNIYY